MIRLYNTEKSKIRLYSDEKIKLYPEEKKLTPQQEIRAILPSGYQSQEITRSPEEQFLKMPWYKQLFTKRFAKELPEATGLDLLYKWLGKAPAAAIAPYVVPKKELPSVVEELVGGVKTKPPSKAKEFLEAALAYSMVAPVGKITGVAKPLVNLVGKKAPVLAKPLMKFLPEALQKILTKPIGRKIEKEVIEEAPKIISKPARVIPEVKPKPELPEVVAPKPIVAKITPELQPLAQEARKYGSAEEFVFNLGQKMNFSNARIANEKMLSGKNIESLSKEFNLSTQKTRDILQKYTYGGEAPKWATDFYTQATKGIKPEIKPVGEIAGKRLGGQPEWWKSPFFAKREEPITIEKQLRGAPILEKLGLTPVREIGKRDPYAGEIAAMGREAITQLENKRAIGWQQAERFFKGLKPQEQELAVNLQEQVITPDKLKAYSPKVQKAVEGMRWFNEEIKKIAQNMGIDTSKWRYDTSNYFHHLFKGDQAVVAKGKIIGFGKLKDALQLAEKYLTSHPGTLREDVLIKPKINLKNTPTTLLSQKGFWAFINKMADKMAVSADDILSEMQGVAGIRPRGRFVGAFLPREANLEGYLKNPEYVYKALWNRIVRKEILDPFGRQATMKLSKIGQTELRKEMQNYIDNLLGKFEEPTTLVGRDISKWMQRITKLQSILKLGYRPSTAFINRLQPLQTVYPIIGKDLFKGSAMRFTKLGEEFVVKSGILAEQPKYYAGEWMAKGPKKSIFHPLWLFGKAERANREETLLGGYIFAKDKLKFTSDKALEFGKELVNSTQYLYNISDLPKVFRSPIGRMAFQFKPFVLNYLYNVKNILTGQELGGLERFGVKLTTGTKVNRAIKFLGTNFAVGGLRTISQLATPVGLGFISYLAIKYPRIFQGALSYAGIDISKRAGASPFEVIPQDMADIFGPSSGDIKRFYKAVKKKDYKEAIRISPMAWDIYKVLSSEKEAAIKPTSFEKILTGLGFEPSRLSTIRETMRYLKYFKPEQKTPAMGLPTNQAIQNIIFNLGKKDYKEKNKEVIRYLLQDLGILPKDYPKYLEQRKERMKKSREK